jgi:hypothetical protein
MGVGSRKFDLYKAFVDYSQELMAVLSLLVGKLRYKML